MAYISVADLKTYIGLSNSDDDTLLTALIASAQAQINAHVNTTFDASGDSTRYFTYGVDTEKSTLYFNEWLAAAPTSVTNGDGVVVTSTDYVLLDSRGGPYYGLRLKRAASAIWTFDESPEDAIAVVGKWGWSTTPPADIIQATRRMAAFLYRAKDSQVFDQTAFTELGVIRVKASMPSDVLEILCRYDQLTGR